MDKEVEIKAKIDEIKKIIQEKYPELLKFLNEIEVNKSEDNNNKEALKNLLENYNSIKSLLNKYIENQKLTNL